MRFYSYIISLYSFHFMLCFLGFFFSVWKNTYRKNFLHENIFQKFSFTVHLLYFALSSNFLWKTTVFYSFLSYFSFLLPIFLSSPHYLSFLLTFLLWYSPFPLVFTVFITSPLIHSSFFSSAPVNLNWEQFCPQMKFANVQTFLIVITGRGCY